jgi:hypothetical protein
MKYIFVCLIVLIGCKAESEIKISTSHNPSNNTESNTAGQNPPNQSNDINNSNDSGSGDSGSGDSGSGDSGSGDSGSGDSGVTGLNDSILIASNTFSDPNPSDNDIHAFVAYSVRRVVENYTGPFFRAKRDDGTEADFGTGVDAIDTVELQNWINGGSGTAYITTWYDQSGNSEHAYQTDQSLMPTLIADCSTAGTPFPCINFNQDTLRFNNNSTAAGVRMRNSGGMALLITIKYNTTGNQMVLGDSATNYELLHYGTRFLCYANEVSHTQSTTDFNLLSVLTDSSNMGYFYSDGSSLGTSSNMWANGSQSDTSKFEYLGKFFDYSGKIANYKITEFILINSVVSREDSSENLHGELITNTLTFYGL